MSATPSIRTRIAAAILMLWGVSACATWTTVQHSPQISGDVRPGEVYRIVRHRESTVELRVSEVRGDTIRGTMRFRADSTLTVVRTDIREMSRFQANDGQSIGLIGGVLLGGAVIVAAAALGGLRY